MAGGTPESSGAAGPAVRVQHGDRTVLFAPASARGTSIGTPLRRGVFYEAQLLEHIRSLGIRGRYVDAGAAIGNHTLFFAAVCDADHVDAFEPRDWVHDLLAENVRLNGLADRITCHRLGLGAGPGETTRLLDGRTTTFQVGALDDVVAGPVALLKIDVEGMEPDVVRGARRILGQDRPVVFAEAGSAEVYAALKARMRESGYLPTGRVFNATPTYEFRPGRGLAPRVRAWSRRGRRWVVQHSTLARRARARILAGRR
jgi:FkbM family methyltransferase